MTFEFEPEKYAQNLTEYAALDETEFKSSDCKEDVIDRLKSISRRKKEISNIQNGIIAEYIERFENGVEELDDDAADRLYRFMNTLYDSQSHACLDAPIGLRLSRLLYSYYHSTNDVEKVVNILYIGSEFESNLSYDDNDHVFFEFPPLCEEYLPDIGSLSSESQIKLLEAYYKRTFAKNRYCVKEIISDIFPAVEKRIRTCIDRMEDKAYGEFILYRFYINLFGLFDMLCKEESSFNKNGMPLSIGFDKRPYLDMIGRCLREVKPRIESRDIDSLPTMNHMLIYLQTRFFAEEITFDELLEGFDKLSTLDEKLGAGGAIDIYASSNYLLYLYACSPYTSDEDARRARKKIEEKMPMILEMRDQGNPMVSFFVLAFLNSVSLFTDFDEFSDIVLSFTVYADKALYVHTIMVRELSRLLFTRLLDTDPDYLAGVCGWDSEYIRDHREEVLELMDNCALCHDIGKQFLLDIVSNSSRRLTDDEFDLIRKHPQNFEVVWEKDHNENVRRKCIRDCALLHHRWHNEKGGYPDLPQTNNLPFVDILAIADSLDAATDSIGRPYGMGKTLDDLISEFLDMSGTRYSREVAELLLDPNIRNAVEDTITNRREDVNYRIYAFNEI